MNEMKSRGAVARYLRIGEPAPERVEPTELGPHELGETGGAVARYLKIERHERPVTKKATATPKKRSRAPKAHRPVIQRRTRVAVELDPADMPQPVSPPDPVEVEDTFTDFLAARTNESAKAKPAKARQKPKRPARAFCPDCEGEIEPGTDQCPHCALFLDKAA
jgi:hypothetical protein